MPLSSLSITSVESLSIVSSCLTSSAGLSLDFELKDYVDFELFGQVFVDATMSGL